MAEVKREGVYTLRDGFFCKTGHEWTTYEQGRSLSYGWPFPTTLRGMLRGAFGRQLDQARRQAGGQGLSDAEWKALTEGIRLDVSFPLLRLVGSQGVWKREERLWPCPKDALAVEEAKGEGEGKPYLRLEPLPPIAETMGTARGSALEEEARESLWFPRPGQKAKPSPLPEWWTESDFFLWLQGGSVIRKKLADYPKVTRRSETHLAIDGATLTNEESMLFSMDLIEPYSKSWVKSGDKEVREEVHEWAVALAWRCPEEKLDPFREVLSLGGKRKLALPSALEGKLLEWPEEKWFDQGFRKGSEGLRLVVVTPSWFQRGWLPDGFQAVAGQGGETSRFEGVLQTGGKEIRVVLRSALVPRSTSVSGWDVVARQPKKTLRLVAPGSVFFVQKVDGQAFSYDEIKGLWLAGWGQGQDDGLGRFVPGLWTPTRTSDRV